MRLRNLAAAAVAAAAITATVAPAPAQTDGSVRITKLDVSAAPEVRVAVSVDGVFAAEPLDEGAFTLLVSGEERPVRITGEPTDPMQVELVVDTSGSMDGAPIAAARAAAAQLVAQLPAAVDVGVVGFGSAPYSAAETSGDRGAVVTAVDSLVASGETALYDAVVFAAARLSTPRRALVILSDGADTVSATSLELATAVLASSGASVFVVSLETSVTDAASLQAIADAAGGQVYSASDPSALESVYASIAAQLSASYELSFDAVRTGSTGIVVRVTAAGATAEAEGRASVPVATQAVAATPATAETTATVAQAPSGLGRDGAQWIGIAALAGALLLAGLVIASRPPVESQLAAARSIRRAGRAGPLQTITEGATGMAERSLDRSGRRTGLERALEHAGIDMRPGEFLVIVATISFAAFAVGFLFAGLLVGIATAVIVVAGSRVALSLRADRRQARFGEQLEQTLPLMASSLRAGFGLMQALDTVAQESPSPTREEFKRVVVETRLGRDLPGALEAMADRARNEDFRWVVQAIEIHQQVGGDLAEVLDNVHATIRDRNKIRRHLKALSGEGRLSAVILFALPIVMFAYISLVNPSYIGELTGRTIGVGMLVGAGVLMVLGGLWMRRIIRLVF